MPLTNSEKIDKGYEIKDEGNAFVKQQEFRKAAKTYRKVFLYINGLISKDNEQMAKFASNDLLSDEEYQRVKALKLTTYSNLALCYLKLEELEKVIECAGKALEVDASHPKANLRMGMALSRMKMWEKAKTHLLVAQKAEPKDVTVNNELKRWKEGFTQWSELQKAKEKAAFGGKLV